MDPAMRTILAQLEMTSNGPTPKYEPIASKGAKGSRVPQGDERPPHIRWRERYLAAQTCEDRDHVLRGARRELDSLRKRTVPADWREQPETEKELRDRMLVEGEGWHFRDVARTFRRDEGWVIRERSGDGRDYEFGRKKVVPIRDKAAEARRLKERNPGMSVRQIGVVTGLPPTSVHRALREAG